MQEEEDENVEENEEYQEGKLRFAGGRKEEATYDAGDEEDKQIAAAVRKEAEGRGGEGEVFFLDPRHLGLIADFMTHMVSVHVVVVGCCNALWCSDPTIIFGFMNDMVSKQCWFCELLLCFVMLKFNYHC